jgi:hypothetical protein
MSTNKQKAIHKLFLILFLLSVLVTAGLAKDHEKAIELNNDYITKIYNPKSNLVINQITLNYDSFQLENYEQLKRELRDRQIFYANLIELTNYKSLFQSRNNKSTYKLLDLVFPSSDFNSLPKIEAIIKRENLQIKNFKLDFLLLESNDLDENFLELSLFNEQQDTTTTAFQLIAFEYFSKIRLANFNFNQFRHLKRSTFNIFLNEKTKSSNIEALLFKSNQLISIKHDAFYDLKKLRYIDLSGNKLKIVHPLTFLINSPIHSSLYYVSLKNNNLIAAYDFLPNSDDDSNKFISSLKHFYFNENKNLKCDCGLKWTQKLKNKINFGQDFKCILHSGDSTDFNKLTASHFDEFCSSNISGKPEVILNNDRFEETSDVEILKNWSKKWFAWTVFEDHLPLTTPSPMLMSQNNNGDEDETIVVEQSRTYLSWLLDTIEFECSTPDHSKTAILWRTQYGYLSNLDPEIVQTLSDGPMNSKLIDNSFQNNNTASFKIFYKMNKLTKIHKNFTISVGKKWASLSHSDFYVNEKNHLIVSNIRNVVVGPFSCLAINENGMRRYDYEIVIRTGVGEYFILSLFVSLIAMIVPSIIGIVVCCICEYQADKNYPMTPPCYPTPLASTPPNFDFNEWMANAASYFPNLNINIHDTLEQVSKKLRKGMEKASVTVKSLGVTSTAYIYSVYEQSSQRWSDMKSYVPTLNVPNLNLTMPTMKYPPTMGQIANRMKSGMGNIFIQMREFCGTSDLTHTASMVDIESDTMACNALGQKYIMDQISGSTSQSQMGVDGHTDGSSLNYYQRFLQKIKEDSKYRVSKKTPPPNATIAYSQTKIVEESENDLSDDDDDQNNYDKKAEMSINQGRLYDSVAVNDDNVPTTSAYATTSSGTSSASSSSRNHNQRRVKNLPSSEININLAKEKLEYSDSDDENKPVKQATNN